MKLLLFDVDGVLVQHRAYHLGVQRAVTYLSERMAIGSHTPTQADIEAFEAATVTIEWETVAIATARLLVDRLRAAPLPEALPEGFWSLTDALSRHPVTIPRPDFQAVARACAETLPGQRPSLAMLERFLEETRADAFGQALAPALRELLGHCYDIAVGPSIQLVQAYAVGAAAYRACYGLEPIVEAVSLLETADRPNLLPETREALLAARRDGRLGFSLYTARPSLPPREAPDRPLGFTPEAEAALTLNNLEGVPVMAVGRLQYVAARHGLSAEDMVKPSRVHAIAALGAACTGLELTSVEAAIRVDAGGPVTEPLTAIAGAEVHVFEDSASSLRAVTDSVALLNSHGLGLTLMRHGIAPDGSAKAAALDTIADRVWADLNAAVMFALEG